MSSQSVLSYAPVSTESARPAKVVFPPPPPTTNRLSPQQRSQLLRSADKLRRVLGATPRLLDSNQVGAPVPHLIQLPMNGRNNRMRPRASIDSLSSIESSSSSDFPASSCSESMLIDSPPSSLRSKKSTGSVKNTESWPSKRLPMLRLSLGLSPLEPIPASPALSTPESAHNAETGVFTMKAGPPSSFDSSPKTPKFAIMSANAERRLKMERLRKKLGDGIPMDLVFPVADIDDPNECSDSDYVSSPASDVSILPSPHVTSHRRLSKKNRIQSTRDSIASITPHRVARKSPGASRSPSPTSEALPAAPTFLLSGSPLFIHNIRDNDDELFVIMEESLNECNSSSGDEKQETRSQSSSTAESIWFDDEDEDGYGIEDVENEDDCEEDEFDFQLQLWDIQRGYGGWAEENSMNPI